MKNLKLVIPMMVFGLLSVGGARAEADQLQSANMIFSHTYDISNSIGAVRNNFRIKETIFVDAKSICRHIGQMTAATRAINTTLFWDKDLQKTAAAVGRMNETLAVLTLHVRETRNFCGRDYSAEGAFDPKKEGNLDFIKATMNQITDSYSAFFAEYRKVDGYLTEKARLAR